LGVRPVGAWTEPISLLSKKNTQTLPEKQLETEKMFIFVA
jgi:hypothetical protein